MTKVTESIAAWIVNTIANHPTAIVCWLGAFVLATLVNSGIKGTWSYAEMPRWARFVLAFTMPLALNYYHLGEKVGIVQPSDQISAGAIRVAIAKEEEKSGLRDALAKEDAKP